MRLKDLITERSKSAEEAEQLGLHSVGWGRWADNDNQVVAKSISTGNGETKLVKVNDVEHGSESPASDLTQYQPANTAVAQTNPPATPSDEQPGSAPPIPPTPAHDDDEEDAYIGGQRPSVVDNDPEQEPHFKGGLEKLLSVAGGDSMKLRKALVNKLRKAKAEGKPTTAKKWLDQLDAYDAAEKAHIRQTLDRINKRKAAQQAAVKNKYLSKYPSPQI